jgi:hypothetical protein
LAGARKKQQMPFLFLARALGAGRRRGAANAKIEEKNAAFGEVSRSTTTN